MKNVFYETGHGIGADQFRIERNADFSYPLHLHRCFEVIYLHKGEMVVHVDDASYVLRSGEMIIIKPHQIHGLQTESHSEHTLCIFSPELIGGAADVLVTKSLIPPVVSDVGDFYGGMFRNMDENDSVYKIKGFLYLLSDAFVKCATDRQSKVKTNKELLVLHRVLSYIEENFAGECSLEDLSRDLNYSYTYLSRIFSENVGISYCSYVTQLRVSKACSMLQNENGNIVDTAYKCGFPSIRSFNRNFIRYTGKTPSEYKNKN